MKPTLKSEGNGNISTVRWILQAKLSTSCWPLNGILQRRGASFRKAIRHHGEPEGVTIDKSGANTAALATLNADKQYEEAIIVRQNKYLNNLVEQDHRNIKRRTRSMQGFKSFRRAQTILAGIELLNIIRKEQYQHPKSGGLSPAEQFYLLAA